LKSISIFSLEKIRDQMVKAHRLIPLDPMGEDMELRLGNFFKEQHGLNPAKYRDRFVPGEPDPALRAYSLQSS
jgi:hypothetical protein